MPIVLDTGQSRRDRALPPDAADDGFRTNTTILVKEAVTRENAVNLLDPGGRN